LRWRSLDAADDRVLLDQRKADQMVSSLEALEDHADDVQHVWANFDFEETA
jgi:hypothetical protein